MFRKSHERDYISWFMGASVILKFLKILKIARAEGECEKKKSKDSIIHKMHKQVHEVICL